MQLLTHKGDTAIQQLEADLEFSTPSVVDFQDDRAQSEDPKS